MSMAHALVRRACGGREAGGLANRYRDADPATPANYLGRVTQAFELIQPHPTSLDWNEGRTRPSETVVGINTH
jgi:hypothetical protein